MTKNIFKHHDAHLFRYNIHVNVKVVVEGYPMTMKLGGVRGERTLQYKKLSRAKL